jgi:hypothetical protein
MVNRPAAKQSIGIKNPPVASVEERRLGETRRKVEREKLGMAIPPWAFCSGGGTQ